jgi:hypothetical protein
VHRLAWPALVLAFACSDDPSGTELEPSTCATLGPTVEILDNHLPTGGEHVLIVPPEDVVNGAERSYDIRGDNVGHTHTVTISTGDFAALRVGDPVTVVSSNNGTVGAGHTHTIALTCP